MVEGDWLCEETYTQLRVIWTECIRLQMYEAADDADWTENKETEKAMDGDFAGKTETGRKRQDWTEKTRQWRKRGE